MLLNLSILTLSLICHLLSITENLRRMMIKVMVECLQLDSDLKAVFILIVYLLYI